MKLTDKVTVSKDAIPKQIGEETVILHLGSGTYFGLDSVGTRIWQLLAENMSLEELCSVMSGEYEVERDRLESEVIRLVSELQTHDLVKKR